MSNLTFSGYQSLQSRLEEEDNLVIPSGLSKYQNILEKISNNHNFDFQLDQKLQELQSSEKTSFDEKSSILNKQYAKYVEKTSDLQLSQVKLVEISADDVISHKETTQFLQLFKNNKKIKFNQFLAMLLKQYNLTFEHSEQKSIFRRLLKQRLVTVDPEYISMNALELSTRDNGLIGLIEQCAEQTDEQMKRQCQNEMNSQIVQELEAVKEMLDKKAQQLNIKEKELQQQGKDILKQKSELGQSVQQVYDILSRMMEETYQNRLTTLNKKFAAIEHQLKAKIKLIETKSQQVVKQNSSSSQEVQRLKQKNLMLEKQMENQKLKLGELEKRLLVEKDNTIAAQKRIEKLQIKISSLEADKKEEPSQLSQQQQPQQQFLDNQKVDNVNGNVSSQSNNGNLQKQIKVYQGILEQIIQAVNLEIPQVLSMDQIQWRWNVLPLVMSGIVDLTSNIINIVINKQGFQSLYQLLLQISMHLYKEQFKTIPKPSNINVEESIKNKQCKFYLNDPKHRELSISLKQILDKKKKSKNQLAALLILYEPRDLSVVIRNLDTDDVQFIIEAGLLYPIVLRMLDDRNLVEILLSLVTQSDILNQVIPYTELLLQMLISTDLEFCEKLSIVLQRLYHSNPKPLSNLNIALLQKKVSVSGDYELLKQNLGYILNLSQN